MVVRPVVPDTALMLVVIGYTVVETEPTGQFVTAAGQEVMVYIFVV